jgi:cytochrome b561
MLIRNTPATYGLLTRLLHWLIAVMILFLVWLGWYMVKLDYYDRWYYDSRSWHESLGMIVLMLAVAKIGWQWYSPLPPVDARLRAWERMSATGMHRLLLVLMVLIPVTGYLTSTSDGKSVEVFAWLHVPAVISHNKPVRDLAISLHYYLAYGVFFLALGHAGAALKHQFLDRDGTLARILWK